MTDESEFYDKWEQILDDVEKHRIPIQFIKKMVLKLEGKRQHTINIQKLLNSGLDPEQVEEAVNKKIAEYDDILVTIEFILNIESIANTVQPATDNLLKNL